MSFSQGLKEAMEKKGVTAYRLSKDLGVHQTTISNWLNGKSTPKAQMLEKIADYFAVTADQLLFSQSVADNINRLMNFVFSKASHSAEDKPSDDLDEETKEFNNKLYGLLFSDSTHPVYQPEFISIDEKLLFEKMLASYASLNETGQRKAVEQIEDLAKIPDYQKKNPDSDNEK